MSTLHKVVTTLVAAGLGDIDIQFNGKTIDLTAPPEPLDQEDAIRWGLVKRVCRARSEDLIDDEQLWVVMHKLVREQKAPIDVATSLLDEIFYRC